MSSSAMELRVAYISDGFPMWPLHIAQSAGLFRAEGIDVQLTITGSSVKQLQALDRGDFDIGIQLPDHIVRAVSRGSDLFAFMATAHAADISLIAAPEIRSLPELKGRVIAVDGANSGYAMLLRRMLQANGIGESDRNLVEVGGTKERFDALCNREADAAFINPPFDGALREKGFVRLTSTLEAFPTYPGIIAASKRSWAMDHEKALTAFVRAYRSAFRWLQCKSNREAAIGIAVDKLPVDQAHAASALDDLAGRAEPVLTVEGMQQVIDSVWEGDAMSQAKPSVEKFIDMRFFRNTSLG